MKRRLTRAEVLYLADYELARFKQLMFRHQLPPAALHGDASGSYSIVTCVCLVVGDLLVQHTSLTREEFSELPEAQVVKMVGGYLRAKEGKVVWLGFRRRLNGAVELTFGTKEDIFADFLSSDTEAGALLSIGGTFVEMGFRADELGVGM